MALKKEIVLENGIKVNYHRIVNLSLVTNKEINILIASYVDETSREQDFLDDKVINTKVFSLEYEEDFNVDKAYEYLKTLKIFENAEDV